MHRIATPADIRVMVVDDSSIIRGLILRVLEAEGMQVVATAANAVAALTMLRRPPPHTLEVDVVIVDVHKQERNDVSYISDLLRSFPKMKVIVTATLNEINVLDSIEALDEGAHELVAKPSTRKNPEETRIFVAELARKVRKLCGLAVEDFALPELLNAAPSAVPPFRKKQVADAKPAEPALHTKPPTPDEVMHLRKAPPLFRPKALAIASSTGGPKALQVFFEGLGKRVSHLPIFLTQHMPKDFTHSLAQQLGKYSGLPSGEGKNNEFVAPGHIYVAPGDYHMLVDAPTGMPQIILHQGPQENFCRPAADPMLRSIFKVYGKDVLVVILTGMGQDGMQGAKLIADGGGVVVAQDRESSVVWGMPGAAAKEGICHHILPLPQLADAVVKLCNGTPL